MIPELEILPAQPAQPGKEPPKKPARKRTPTKPAAASGTAPADTPPTDASPVPPEFPPPDETEFPTLEAYPGYSMEPAFPAASPSLVETPEKGKDSSEPKAGPPTLDEWQDFFARIVLRAGTEFLLNVMLGDVMDQLTPHEQDMIRLTSEDLREMAAPFASLANKSKPMRKHGRTIIAAADSWEAVLALGIWLRRVNRIGRKYRGPREPGVSRRQQRHAQQHEQQSAQAPMEGIVITEGTNGHGRAGQDNGAGPRFGVFNPGTGG